MSSLVEFPPVLYEYWQASDEELSTAIVNGLFQGVTVSSLLKAYLDVLLEKSGQREDRFAIPSLKHISIGKVVTELKATDDLPATATNIAQSLDHITYHQLLSDARLPYPILRTILRTAHAHLAGDGSNVGYTNTDVDEAILANEDHLRHLETSLLDCSYLVTLDDLCNILGISARRGFQAFRRDCLSKVELPFTPEGCNFYKEPALPTQIITSDADFTDIFDRNTLGLLRGLDWTNIFVTGELILASLTDLHTEADTIHIHLYGLNADDANSKVEEIYNVWLANLPAKHEQEMVVKSPNVTFYPLLTFQSHAHSGAERLIS